jgi:hypothetical protein
MLEIRVKGEAGGWVDIRTLETLFRTEIHLLCLSNFFEQFLNDNPVVVPSFTKE